MPEVFADRDPEFYSQARVHGPEPIASGEKASLVEEAVRGQEELAVYEPDLAVFQQRGRYEESVVHRLLDERDDGRDAVRLRREAQKTRIVLSHRHFGREVLELVTGQAELGKDDQAGAGGAR